MTAYYNEIDRNAAAWLRELIREGLIADGIVDERSIAEVAAGDLDGFDQCHFFAGIGGWSYALRLAGWPDDKPVWTGSCPCQPFSVAGKGKGTDDERHLWPEFHRLIAECHPAIVFGEQVASRAGRDWLAAVRADLEDVGYACGAADLCAAGVGAPHIRQRLFWGAARVENPMHSERWSVNVNGQDGCDGQDSGRKEAHGIAGARSQVCRLADMHGHRCDQAGECQPEAGHDGLVGNGAIGGVADAERNGQHRSGQRGAPGRREFADGRFGSNRPGPDHGGWRDADWLHCRDGKWRPVEPGTFPLAHGIPARVGRLRGYGNAIVPHAAAVFVRAFA